MTYPEVDSSLRSDESFKDKLDENYHKPNRESPLEQLSLGLVSNVPLDYMHLVCLGVMKRLLIFWVKGSRDVRMREDHLNCATTELLKIKNYIPREFSRLPRDLKEVDRLKATEFRQVLLYTGPIILKQRLDQERYLHFLSLHCAIRILCSSELSKMYIDYASELLKYFVRNYSILYGAEYITHNVHNLVHLANDCKVFGPLDQFSAFKYENYLYKIKKSVKFCRYPLQQAVNRCREQELVYSAENFEQPHLKNETVKHPKIFEDLIAYKNLITRDFEVIVNSKDNCVALQDNSIYKIEGICQNPFTKGIYLFGRRYIQTESFYDSPCNSKQLFNIVIATSLSENLSKMSLSDVKYKCLNYPKVDCTLIVPLLHNENHE